MPGHRSSRFYFSLFGALYFVQDVITSYQLNSFKPYMASAGIDAVRIPADAMTFGAEVVFRVLQQWGQTE